jgi:hypothetical protein
MELCGDHLKKCYPSPLKAFSPLDVTYVFYALDGVNGWMSVDGSFLVFQ